MKIIITNTFEKATKKLHRKQVKEVEDAIETIAKNPMVGEAKKGDLAGVQVYKFRIDNQLILLAYIYDDVERELTLLSLGSHENFYRDLKKNL
ncbi:MAG: addiction module toxin RelE [Gammaproteobacteria bacterium RIFCSPLOWO2_02_FULL_38_11]|nr:MAG: addiction module toxin RelE [Gammaproteobacteria bacterium RIFCSPHIGHO2_12_38_15]OGT67874.1 MAG: addiction module toxin RelE [Gammaproteobacteria bacterium RIFCSPLOWO2_02_FULL_38_11]